MIVSIDRGVAAVSATEPVATEKASHPEVTSPAEPDERVAELEAKVVHALGVYRELWSLTNAQGYAFPSSWKPFPPHTIRTSCAVR